jgi:calpain family cysteine protease
LATDTETGGTTRIKDLKPRERPENIGAANPYALAEVRLGRKVNWQRTPRAHEIVEQALGMKYEDLFDPRKPSPIFAGKAVKKNGKTVRSDPPIDVGSVVWADPGEFFDEAAEFFDPVQGAVGDCYLIAALASVAWARPYLIAQRTRATGTGQPDFVDMIEIHEGATTKQIEVTEKLPLNSPGNTYIYCRSSETGEIWPAVYEKAYAKWRTKVTTDTPDISAIAGGDPVAALAQLSGLTPYYFSNPSIAAHDIWQKVRENSLSRKTFNPMVAWTYCSPPAGVNYSSAHIAGCHAYSILGWSYDNAKEYIVLRNPWGFFEATLNVDSGSYVAYDGSFWRTINLTSNDGTFALEAPTFKKYFAGFGLVK